MIYPGWLLALGANTCDVTSQSLSGQIFPSTCSQSLELYHERLRLQFWPLFFCQIAALLWPSMIQKLLSNRPDSVGVVLSSTSALFGLRDSSIADSSIADSSSWRFFTWNRGFKEIFWIVDPLQMNADLKKWDNICILAIFRSLDSNKTRFFFLSKCAKILDLAI